MSSKYYLGVSVVALSLSIYNLHVASTGKKYQCYKSLTLSFEEYIEYNKSQNITLNDTSLSVDIEKNEEYEIEINTKNSYVSLLITIGVFYLIFFLLSLYLSIVINSLANQLPRDFLDMGLGKKINSMFCKIFPKIFILFSWIIFILIIILWSFLGAKKCEKSRKISDFSDKERYYNDVKVLNIVNICFWIVLHYFGSVIRHMTYQEPFMYSPVDINSGVIKKVFFSYLGP